MESLLLCKLERFTGWRLSYFPGIVKLWESPGRAGGLPKRNYLAQKAWSVALKAESQRYVHERRRYRRNI